MTVPEQRRSAVVHTGQFLCDLLDARKWPKVPSGVRETARRLLKHYPSQYHLSGEHFDEGENPEDSSFISQNEKRAKAAVFQVYAATDGQVAPATFSYFETKLQALAHARFLTKYFPPSSVRIEIAHIDAAEDEGKDK